MRDDSEMVRLREAVNQVSASKTTEEKLATLLKAFELFNQETSRLEAAYAALQKQFHDVNSELEKTNSALQDKVTELDSLSSYLHSILSNITQGLLFIDMKGIVRTYNPAAETILDVAAQRVLARPFWEQFPDDFFGFSVKEILSSHRPLASTSSIIKLSEGGNREVEVEMTFVNPPEEEDGVKERNRGQAQGLILLIRDITEIRRLQQIASRNDRLKELGEMAARMAHEIRNPLGGVKGFALLLERDLIDLPDQKQMAAYIVEGTEIINQLVSNILNYARPLQLELTPIDFTKLFEELKKHFLATYKVDSQIQIKTSVQPMHTPVLLDEHGFHLALLNLMLNGIQAMPEGGLLSLNAQQRLGETIITVSDTGIGIAPENRDKLFSPFFTTKVDGNGFGLAEVYKIVQAHGGVIEVESQIGKGTTFSIKIPIKT